VSNDTSATSAWLPASATADARRLLVTRAARGFADGVVSVLLATWLQQLGFTPFQIGAIVTATLLGSAALTLVVGLFGHRVRRRAVLVATAGLMVATGLGFAGVTSFWPLLVIAFVGTINPSAGDVTVFLPTEQAVLASAVAARDRTLLFAWYNLLGALAGALGALAAGLPPRAAFLVYALLGLFSAAQYRRLSPHAEVEGDRRGGAATDRGPLGGEAGTAAGPLTRSRRVVLQLAALFCIDSFGGGFVVQSLLALWLYRRFGLSVETAGAFFFGAGLLGAGSQIISSRLAARIGHVRTMVFTHLPSNALLVMAGLMPSASLALLSLLLRALLSQMDVPARQAYVMALVPPVERAAASSVTNVPRALASAVSPLIAGALLERTAFGWPLICAGALKTIYDLLLFASFARRKPPEE
jgi:MFS family permease